MSQLLQIQNQISGDIGIEIMQPFRRFIRMFVWFPRFLVLIQRMFSALDCCFFDVETGEGTVQRVSKGILSKGSKHSRIFLFNDLVRHCGFLSFPFLELQNVVLFVFCFVSIVRLCLFGSALFNSVFLGRFCLTLSFWVDVSLSTLRPRMLMSVSLSSPPLSSLSTWFITSLVRGLSFLPSCNVLILVTGFGIKSAETGKSKTFVCADQKGILGWYTGSATNGIVRF
jgi:hypothetical protein